MNKGGMIEKRKSTLADIEALMKAHFRFAHTAGLNRGETDYQRFYLFAPSAVQAIHTRRLVPGTPPEIRLGLWFRLFNGIVVHAVTGEHYSVEASAPALYDMPVN